MVYYSLILIGCIFSVYFGSRVRNEKEKRLLCFVIFIPIIFIIACRNYTVGADTYSYYYIYNKMSNYDTISTPLSTTWMEVGYVALTYLLNHLGLSYFSFQIIVSFFYFVSFKRVIVEYSDNVGMSSFLFVSMGIMFGVMNQTRMWISVAISLYALDSLKKRNLLKFVIIILIASSFHTSAIVLLLAYPISYFIEKNFVKTTRFVLLMCTVIMIIGRPFFTWITKAMNRYASYIDRSNERFGLAAILNFLIDAFIFYFVYMSESRNLKTPLTPGSESLNSSERIEKCDNDNTQKTNTIEKTVISYMYSLITLGLSLIELSNSYVSRVIVFYSFPMVFIFSNSIEKVKDSKNRLILKAIVIALFSIKMYTILIYRPKWDAVLPYEFFWKS